MKSYGESSLLTVKEWETTGGIVLIHWFFMIIIALMDEMV